MIITFDSYLLLLIITNCYEDKLTYQFIYLNDWRLLLHKNTYNISFRIIIIIINYYKHNIYKYI
jgi:hypothetical protein